MESTDDNKDHPGMKKKNRNYAESALNIHASTTGSGITRGGMRVDLFSGAGLTAVAGRNVGNDDIPRGKLGLGVNSVKTELGICANWMEKASAGMFTAGNYNNNKNKNKNLP